jgi:undecaprenyl-diphosphatase
LIQEGTRLWGSTGAWSKKNNMNVFDLDILQFLNQFAHHSRTLDGIAGAITSQALFKGWFMVALFWWVWFKPGKANAVNREIVVATLASAVLAVVVGRLLADFLPFRSRPLQSPELGFVLPYGVTTDSLRSWSSFPSDHAMVFFAMSTGLWYVSRMLGAASTLYVICIIALPRVYMGYHYPTDVIGGALLGALFAYLANLERVRSKVAAPAMKWLDRHPASFYTCFFLFSQALAALFDPVRHLAVFVRSLVV